MTSDHVRLLQRMYVGWQNCETGAPEIDPKRPYGNSDVESDVAEILGWKLIKDRYGDDVLTEEQASRAMEIHREMEDVLQILVRHPLDFTVGEWRRVEQWNYEWELVSAAD